MKQTLLHVVERNSKYGKFLDRLKAGWIGRQEIRAGEESRRGRPEMEAGNEGRKGRHKIQAREESKK